MKVKEIIVSNEDARILSGIINSDVFGDAAAPLAADLHLANVQNTNRLPANVVGMNCTVRYSELPEGDERTIVVVHPAQANAQSGRFSVLSPVGRAVLGRKVGSTVEVMLPTGNSIRIKILAVVRGEGDA